MDYKPEEFTDCLKCAAWRMAAVECGYYDAMCEDCFNNRFVLIKEIYDAHEQKNSNGL